MEGEDVGLEVVDEAALPLLHGEGEDVRQGARGLAGRDAGVGIARGNVDVGLHDDDGPAGEVDANGREAIADASGEHGAVLDEEGAVGAEGCYERAHLRGAHAELELFVEEPHHEGGVAATTAESSARWYMLENVYVKCRKMMFRFNSSEGAYDKVVGGVAVEDVASLAEAAASV